MPLDLKTRIHHAFLREGVRLVLFFGIVVRDFNVLQTNSLLAVVKHVRQFMEESEPHRRALLEAVVQLD